MFNVYRKFTDTLRWSRLYGNTIQQKKNHFFHCGVLKCYFRSVLFQRMPFIRYYCPCYAYMVRVRMGAFMHFWAHEPSIVAIVCVSSKLCSYACMRDSKICDAEHFPLLTGLSRKADTQHIWCMCIHIYIWHPHVYPFGLCTVVWCVHSFMHSNHIFTHFTSFQLHTSIRKLKSKNSKIWIHVNNGSWFWYNNSVK